MWILFGVLGRTLVKAVYRKTETESFYCFQIILLFSLSHVFSARLLLTLTRCLFAFYQGKLPVKRRIITVTVTLRENERMLDRF